MVAIAVTLAATAISDDHVVLLAARAAAGAAGAAVFVAGGVIATRVSARAASTTPITLHFAGAVLGIAASGAALPPIADHWRLAWAALSLAAALATLASWTAADAGEREPSAAANPGAREPTVVADASTGSALPPRTRARESPLSLQTRARGRPLSSTGVPVCGRCGVSPWPICCSPPDTSPTSPSCPSTWPTTAPRSGR